MPKKTKKQKLLTQMRKRTHQSHPATRIDTIHIPSEQSKNESVYQFTAKELAHQKESLHTNPEMTNEFAAIRKDLTVTVILAAVAISMEYVLAHWMR